MATAPPSITPIPDFPSLGDRLTYNAKAYAWATAIDTVTTPELSAVAANVYSNALAAESDALATDTDRLAASASAGTAATQATNAATSALSAVNAPGTSGTSTTSLTVGTGTQTFTTQTAKAWVVGQPVSIARTSAPGTTYMYGTITAYNSGTGSMSVLVGTGFIGSGTFTDWTIGLSGTGLPLKTVGGQSLLGAGDVPIGGSQIGDVFTGTQAPSVGTWLPLSGGIYLQSSYTALYTQLGLLADRASLSGLYQTGLPFSLGNFTSMAFGAGVYVALLSGTATAYSSPDGLTWTARSLPSSQSWSKVIFANGVFVAVATATSSAATSTDGINWTSRIMPSSSNWRGLAFGNGVFVAASDGTSWATSADAVSWTARTGPAGVPQGGGVYFGNSLFLVFSSVNGTAYTGTEGINWTSRAMPIVENITASTFGGSLFVCYTQNSGGNVQSTADGVTWRVGSLPMLTAAVGYQVIVYASGSYVIPGSAASPGYISTDAVNWRQNTYHNGTSFSPVAGAYANGRLAFCQNSASANNFARSSLFLTYNTATQFALPEVSATLAGTKQWIRAL